MTCRNLRISKFLKRISFLSVVSFKKNSFLSDVISPDSSLVLIIICLFLCLLICLGPFLASNVSCINSFLFLCALVLRFFFTNLLSSAYSALSFSVLFVFCRNSILFFFCPYFQFLYLQYSSSLWTFMFCFLCCP